MAKSSVIQMDLAHVVPDREPLGTLPLWDQFKPGLLCELSGRGRGASPSSVATRLVVRAQAEGEPVAWVAPEGGSCVFPPDLAAAGVDLNALVFVRVPQKGHALVRATEVLLRSGAFGLVILDLSEGVPARPLVWQSRLNGLVRLHESRLAMVTSSSREQPSLGPLVSLRVEGVTDRSGERAVIAHTVLKSKLGGQVGLCPEVRQVPAGAEPVRVVPELIGVEPARDEAAHVEAGVPGQAGDLQQKTA